MPWNPEIYNHYKKLRFQPFYDLSDLLIDDHHSKAVDIGCGTGEQTHLLAQRFKQTSFLGIDSSSEMLEKAAEFKRDNLNYKMQKIEDFVASNDKWDLIFSNAALQWVPDHPRFFSNLIEKLNVDGQIAIQMPMQKDNALNILLDEIVQLEPFKTELNGFRQTSPVLDLDEYAQILFKNRIREINISVRCYPIISDSNLDLYNFISGSTLIPYFERLNRKSQQLLKEVFLTRINAYFSDFPAFYPFKRILLYGIKKHK